MIMTMKMTREDDNDCQLIKRSECTGTVSRVPVANCFPVVWSIKNHRNNFVSDLFQRFSVFITLCVHGSVVSVNLYAI